MEKMNRDGKSTEKSPIEKIFEKVNPDEITDVFGDAIEQAFIHRVWEYYGRLFGDEKLPLINQYVKVAGPIDVDKIRDEKRSGSIKFGAIRGSEGVKIIRPIWFPGLQISFRGMKEDKIEIKSSALFNYVLDEIKKDTTYKRLAYKSGDPEMIVGRGLGKGVDIDAIFTGICAGVVRYHVQQTEGVDVNFWDSWINQNKRKKVTESDPIAVGEKMYLKHFYELKSKLEKNHPKEVWIADFDAYAVKVISELYTETTGFFDPRVIEYQPKELSVLLKKLLMLHLASEYSDYIPG